MAVVFIDAIPLTAVGKVFKPTLRWAAAQRVVRRMLADLLPATVEAAVEVGADPMHGSLITVTLNSLPEAKRAHLEAQICERLNPLTTRHTIVWR